MANKHLTVGPGGRRCNCCFPAPGSKDRRARYRIAKRRADREAMKIALEDWHEALAEQFASDYLDPEMTTYELESDWMDDYWRDADLEEKFADDHDDRYSHYMSDWHPSDMYWHPSDMY